MECWYVLLCGWSMKCINVVYLGVRNGYCERLKNSIFKIDKHFENLKKE
jgi:hypothetical protein